MGIDGLAISVIPYIRDVLRLLSHTAARYIETDRWLGIVERFKETDASDLFLRGHIDIILAHFDDARLPLEESIQIVGQAVQGIFDCHGIGFRTIPERVYISVREPSG